ncbi:hypothetical protein GWI33_012931 [Rhynchophorus ferrugineus]|uniref:Uncharacterized protein n=1 Tax=Rhynchophorus ferrugineus TaxID=354439 RepID=A0A834MAH1_RHYFE|nr:hypothetical protein GWI33_012931 [Rhynchophorus ferrugineus]
MAVFNTVPTDNRVSFHCEVANMSASSRDGRIWDCLPVLCSLSTADLRSKMMNPEWREMQIGGDRDRKQLDL